MKYKRNPVGSHLILPEVPIILKQVGYHLAQAEMVTDKDLQNCQELSSISTAQHVLDIYNRVKERNWLIRTYCGGLEKCGSFLMRRVYPFTKLANIVDSKVVKIKEDYPVVNLPPKKILFSFLSWSNNPHSACLESSKADGVEVVHSSTIKPKPKQSDQSGTTSSGESNTNTAILNSGSTTSLAIQTSKMTGSNDQEKMLIIRRIPLVSRTYRIFVLTPLDLIIQSLRAIRHFIFLVRYGRHGGSSSGKSPMKVHHLRSRRKVSPRKRIHTTFIGRIANNTCRMLGLKPPSPLRQKDIKSCFTASSQNQEFNKSPNRGDSENKRKHDEIQSDSDEDNWLTMNLEDYRSDDDPDYEQSCHESSDETIEADDELQESDVEVENLPGGQIQIKAKDCTETVPATSSSDSKLTKDLPLDDWQEIDADRNTNKSQTEPRTTLGEMVSHSNVISPVQKSDKKEKIKIDNEKPKSPASRIPERRHSEKSEKSKPEAIKEQVKADRSKTPEAPRSFLSRKNSSTNGASSRAVDEAVLDGHGVAKKERTPSHKV